MTLLLEKHRTHLIDDLSVNLANHLIADQHFKSESLSAEESEVFYMLLDLAIIAKRELQNWVEKRRVVNSESWVKLASKGYDYDELEELCTLSDEEISSKAELITGKVVVEGLQHAKNKDLELLYKHNLLDRERWAEMNGAPTIVDLIKKYIV